MYISIQNYITKFFNAQNFTTTPLPNSEGLLCNFQFTKGYKKLIPKRSEDIRTSEGKTYLKVLRRMTKKERPELLKNSVEFIFEPRDFWIGVFIGKPKSYCRFKWWCREIYILPLPMLGIRITWFYPQRSKR